MKNKSIDEIFEIGEIHKLQLKGEENKEEKKEVVLYDFYIPYYHKFRIIINKFKSYFTLEGAI